MQRPDPLKPEGAWEVRRSIAVPSLTEAGDAARVESQLGELGGVCAVAADATRHRIKLRYDASRTDYQAVAAALKRAGFPPSDDWWSRLKGNWFQFTDTNAHDNASEPPPSCCNKPPK
jgi:copper chaperone CopZ